jgi:hypothetical protein
MGVVWGHNKAQKWCNFCGGVWEVWRTGPDYDWGNGLEGVRASRHPFNLLGKAGFPAYAQRREGGSMPLPASPGLSSTSSFPGSIPACGQHRCGGFLTSSPASVVNARAPHSVSEISVRGDGPTFGGDGCGSFSTGKLSRDKRIGRLANHWDPSGLPCPGNEAFACDQN